MEIASRLRTRGRMRDRQIRVLLQSRARIRAVAKVRSSLPGRRSTRARLPEGARGRAENGACVWNAQTGLRLCPYVLRPRLRAFICALSPV
eukprot:6214725-Pleurochrysis_carterae.AAC.3